MDATSLNGSPSLKTDPETSTLWLGGALTGAYKASVTRDLAVLLAERRHDITVDLTRVTCISNSMLEVFTAIASLLTPPRRLIMRAPADLEIPGRLATRLPNPETLAQRMAVHEE
ncbi:hypothetical protein H9Y04_25350 [Streptomyces sp. TRM66268-LWL]|uniref:STAS domain-containing protein n=1 Tax=Streptomyces polyasparticus TaxID=2767826 RepID=A0ABR7SMG6_9ACTN|nr:hypothetical protein [Streptomyces polyasparticus]MBC9715870.1 hypothetical protein [Streptomyces polyasparticus]